MIGNVSTTNAEIALVFERMPGILEMDGEAGFKTRAYRRGSLTIRELPTSLEQMVKDNINLEKVPSFGKTIAAKIKELLTTGQVQAYERLPLPHQECRVAPLSTESGGGAIVHKPEPDP